MLELTGKFDLDKFGTDYRIALIGMVKNYKVGGGCCGLNMPDLEYTIGEKETKKSISDALWHDGDSELAKFEKMNKAVFDSDKPLTGQKIHIPFYSVYHACKRTTFAQREVEKVLDSAEEDHDLVLDFIEKEEKRDILTKDKFRTAVTSYAQKYGQSSSAAIIRWLEAEMGARWERMSVARQEEDAKRIAISKVEHLIGKVNPEELRRKLSDAFTKEMLKTGGAFELQLREAIDEYYSSKLEKYRPPEKSSKK